ncbi:MAG: methylmalonyl-CoA mutase [Acidobacteriia bacterium]|nr:methylmalonyl-CoA mutase [Terriglobia bacterium]
MDSRDNEKAGKKFSTSSGLELKESYRPEDLAGWAPEQDLGIPGEYPFTRGIHPSGYRGRLWTMRQYAGFGTAQESNARFRYLLSQGQTGLSVAFDLPTQIGLDSDHPLARGEVGRVGVAIDSLEDMEVLFAGIPLEGVSASMTINATAAILLALYLAVAEKHGADPKKLSGTIQNDVLKEYIARGTYIYPPEAALRIVTDIFAFCQERVPEWNTISISGYHIREAGSTAVQEVAFTFANAIAYVEAARARGLDVDDFAPRLSFFFAAHNDLLEEVAKFRAARRLWARLMRERFAAKNPRSWMLRFHTQTAGSTLTAQQPDVNIVRVTLQALAAVLGGTQSLHTNARDEALALPTEASALLALRTQQIIAQESGVAHSVDPLAGSYALENLTDRIERAAEEYLRKIGGMGGVLRAIESGYIQREIQQAAYEHQKSVEGGERVVVGVNRYVSDAPTPPTLHIDPEIERGQIARLRDLRARRDAARVAAALQEVESAARSDRNLLPPILEAVKVYATVGEVSNALRQAFGEYQESVVI